jgi:hypothetical protein
VSSTITPAALTVPKKAPSMGVEPMRGWSVGRREAFVLCAAGALVLWRSAVFLLRPEIAFDGDQAVFGLMTKHLVEGRAFPLFLYGANYMLAVQSWMAAPLFLLFGPSAAVLKIPLLLVNIAIALLLVKILLREVGLAPTHALVAALFFLVAAPGTTTLFLQANGGNVEPLLYTLLLWMTRRRPAWFGVILGVGFLQREFTMYAAAAILLFGLLDGSYRAGGLRRALQALRSAAEVWLVVQCLRPFSSPVGPGTTLAPAAASNNVAGMLERLCIDPTAFGSGLLRLVTVHWGQLFGTTPFSAVDFGLESATWQGVPGSGLLLAVLALTMAVRVAMRMRRAAIPWKQCAFCAYLMLVGAISALVYALGRCGEIELGTMRYELLSLLGAVGLAGWFFAVENQQGLRRAVIGLLVACTTISAASHAALWAEYVRRPGPTDKQLIIRHLEARGIRYIEADYWIAYYVAFMTNEQIIAASTNVTRIQEYERLAAAHHSELIYVSREPCGTERPVIEGVYFCPPL